MRRALFLAVAAVLAPLPLAAQEQVRIPVNEARQCAIWSAFLGSQMTEDPATEEALVYVTNYFVGYYEGVTGQSITEGDDLSSAEAVTANMEQVTEICAGHMAAYGERMSRWGTILTQLGEKAEGK